MTRACDFRWRAINDAQMRRVRQMRASGVTVERIAEEFSVSVRTVYRALRRAEQPVELVRVRDWYCHVAITDEGPVQVTPWLAA